MKNAPNTHEARSASVRPPLVPVASTTATGPVAANRNATAPLPTWVADRSRHNPGGDTAAGRSRAMMEAGSCRRCKAVRKIIGHAQLVCNAARTGAVLQISTVRASGSGVRDACRLLPKIACASLVRCRGTRLRSARQLPRRPGKLRSLGARCCGRPQDACRALFAALEKYMEGRLRMFVRKIFHGAVGAVLLAAGTVVTVSSAQAECSNRTYEGRGTGLLRATAGIAARADWRRVKSQAAADPIIHAGRGHAAGSRPAASRKAKAGAALPGPAPATAEAIRDLLGNRAGEQPLPGFASPPCSVGHRVHGRVSRLRRNNFRRAGKKSLWTVRIRHSNIAASVGPTIRHAARRAPE